MLQRKNIPLISYCLILSGILFGMEQENGFVIGDFIISKFGFPICSKGTEGLHYSGLVTLFLLLIALMGFALNADIASPRVKKLALFTFFFGHLLIRPVFIESYGFIKGLNSGLGSVDYYRNQSASILRSISNNTKLRISSNLSLVNYSKDYKEFYIKQLTEISPDKLTNDKYLIAIDEGNMKPKKFILNPQSKVQIEAIFIATQNELYKAENGFFSRPDIVLYNEREEVKFVKGQYD